MTTTRSLFPQIVVTSLQERVLNFIQQLHSSESERKQLQVSVDSLSNGLAQLKEYEQMCSGMEGELRSVKQQVHTEFTVISPTNIC